MKREEELTVSEQLAEALDHIKRLIVALKPFSDFAINVEFDGDLNTNAWKSRIHRESISTWFGPSDFAYAAFAVGDTNDRLPAIAASPKQEAIFWYRPVGVDGGYEGPYHSSSETGKSLRASKADEWKPLYAHPPKPEATNEAAQITMGRGLVDVTRIDHEARSGILFRPRDPHIPVGEPGELQAGEYWPVAGDVVIWIENEGGASVIYKYLRPFLPQATEGGDMVPRSELERLESIHRTEIAEMALRFREVNVERVAEQLARIMPSHEATEGGAHEKGIETVLEKPAMVGRTIFRTGVKVSVVIGAAQRLYEKQWGSAFDALTAKQTDGREGK